MEQDTLPVIGKGGMASGKIDARNARIAELDAIAG